MKITPNLHFTGQCKNALKLYEQAFSGKITVLLYYKDANENDFSSKLLTGEQKNYVYHSEMIIGNQRFMFSDTIEKINKGQNISIVITFDTPKAVKTAYEVLKVGAKIVQPLTETTYSSCFVSLIDRFGMRWELMTEN